MSFVLIMVPIIRFLVVNAVRGLAGYGVFRIVESSVANPDTVINTASEKTGVPKIALWGAIIVACFFILKRVFKLKLV